MELDDPSIYAPSTENAINRHPLTATPETPLVTVIALMSQARGKSCFLPGLYSSSDSIPMSGTPSSCVLVMEKQQLLGIFTERDLVRLVAEGRNFKDVKVSEVMARQVITLPLAKFQDIFAAVFLFRRYRIRHLPIVDEQGQLIGIVSPESIRQMLQPANLLKLRRVAEVMTPDVVSLPLTTSVLDVARLMTQQQISCVVITQEDAERGSLPVGIITERDIVQFQSLQLDLSQTKAETVMSTPLFMLSPEDSLWTAHQEMQQRHLRRLVVSWNWGKGLGMVTQTSLLRVFDPTEMYWVIETLQQTVKQLEAKTGRLPKPSNAHTQPQHPEVLSAAQRNLTTIKSHELQTLLSNVHLSLESLMEEPNLSPQVLQSRLNSTLAEIEQIRNLMSRQETPMGLRAKGE